ncbi:hypothetical protein [Agrilutibacter solisilvae]|uniref:Uncharacterized protein n=1 Tax=Agrilutibacter solisilvae TaxID=2763317 RepID=A0A974Y0V5_9GAMM|nr:hypothetical protein [Lysobacter solisilvae]QSX79366.1 hypothetical protein I8J32_005760 [Lysobacter solisilvae]QSX79371.1 hypothetical protein I8J32_005785 [Lysobacter solisilvae]
MKEHRHPAKSFIAWLLLFAGSYALGAGLSGFASTFGITDFPNDRRGEWGLIATPIVLAIALAIGLWPFRYLLQRTPRWFLLLATVLATSVSFAWITWRFATAT